MRVEIVGFLNWESANFFDARVGYEAIILIPIISYGARFRLDAEFAGILAYFRYVCRSGEFVKGDIGNFARTFPLYSLLESSI